MHHRTMISVLRGWLSPGTDCSEGQWSLLLRRYSKAVWTQFCVICQSRGICLSRKVGLDVLQRSLPTSTVSWFRDSAFTVIHFTVKYAFTTTYVSHLLVEIPLAKLCLSTGANIGMAAEWSNTNIWLLKTTKALIALFFTFYSGNKSIHLS